MIGIIGVNAPSTVTSAPSPAVSLDERVKAAAAAESGSQTQSTADVLDQMVRSFATHQFLEAMMFGEPDETGLPLLTFEGDAES
jgi:hypothetical protein